MEVLQSTDWTILILSLIMLGCFAGFLAGLLGIGGGIVLVPGLFYIFSGLGLASDTLMHVCVGTSLAVIIPTGLSSARAHHKRGHVDMELVRLIGGGILFGVLIGTVTADFLSSMTLKFIFAAAILILSLMMMINTRDVHLSTKLPSKPVTTLVGTVVGTISTLIGVGGATMNVPFMTNCGVPIHRAIGTASALGLFIAIPAAAGFILIGLNETGRPPYSLGFVNIPAWALIIPSSILIARLGAYAAYKAPVKLMRRIFAVFMVIVSIKLWSDLL